MRVIDRPWRPWVWSVLLAIALTGCAQVTGVRQAFELRDVHDLFARAVQADNTATIDPFLGGHSEALYREVAQTLSDTRIAELDPRLQPNAWLLRAVAAWRTGDQAGAVAAATHGLAAPGLVPQSRDQILLALIPALAIDAELRHRLAQRTSAPSFDEYSNPTGDRIDFETAVTHLTAAEALIGPATPAAVIHYVAYQRWRVLNNWRYTINRLDQRAARQNAHVAAAAFLHTDNLQTAITAAAEVIPTGEPLRQLITAQSGVP